MSRRRQGLSPLRATLPVSCLTPKRLALAGACLAALTASAGAAPVCTAPVPGAAAEGVRGFAPVAGGWLADARNGAIHVNDRGAMASRLDGPALGPVDRIVEINADQSIVIKNRDGSGTGGVYLLDAKEQKLQEVAGSEPLQVAVHGKLSSGGFLLGSDRGLYRIEAVTHELRELPKPAAGPVSTLQVLDDGNWLAGAHHGLFRVDSRGGRVDAVQGPETGAVNAIRRLRDGAWLIGAERGLFRADAGGRALTALPIRRGGRILDLHKLAEGSFIVRSDGGLLLVDADGKKMDVLSEDSAVAWRVLASNDKGALLGNERLLYAYANGSKRLEQLSGEPGGEVYSTHDIPEGWLVSTRRGLFKVEFPKVRVSAVKGPAVGAVGDLLALRSGDWLLRTKSGLFRADAALKTVAPVAGPAVGEIRAVKALKDGGALVGAEQGLFRIDPEAQGLSPVEGSALADVASLSPLANGDWLAVSQGGVARIDAAGRGGVPIAVPGAGAGVAVQPLPQGGVLFGTPKGLSVASGSLGDAKVQVVSRSADGMVWNLRHVCASAADSLGLMVEARPVSAPEAPPRALRVSGFQPDGEAVRFSVDLSSLPSGDWTLRLASATGGGPAIAIGEPVSFSRGETAWDWMRRHQAWVAGAALALALAALMALLAAAHRRGGALRVLRHPIARLFLWPSLLFRFSSSARLWVLGPWHARMRTATPSDRSFYDVPVTGPDGAEKTAMALLGLAGKQQRVWLRGAVGMGKTETLAAYRRAFFAGHATLEDAVKATGFILAPVSAYAFADFKSHAPEEAVAEAIRRSFVDADCPMDRGLLRILLRKGDLLVAIDDATDADRDGPIAAFVRAYPKTRLVVASRAMAPESFEMWRLPAKIGPHVEPLLSLWLGAYSGKRLAARAARENLTADLVSAFDVRLLADFVTIDPTRALPAARTGLYQAALDRVAFAEGAVRWLEPIKADAWTMVVEGRRVLRADEVESLGASTIAALADARVLRSEGGEVAFAHDLMRLFLAAQWLTETCRDARAVIAELEGSGVWRCGADDQIELWRFVAQLIAPEYLAELWPFALETIDRVYLQTALYARARSNNIFPLGLTLASGQSTRRRLGSTPLSAAGA